MKLSLNINKFVAIGIIFVLLLIFTFFIVGLKVKFLFSEELIVDISPSSLHLQGERDTVKETITISTQNFLECAAQCTYSLSDLKNNIQIKSGTLKFDSQKSREIDIFVEPEQTGEGIKLYSFDVSCSNIKSTLCFTQETKVLKTTLITLNYTYTDDERYVKEFIDSSIETLIEENQKIKIRIEQSKIMLSRLPQISEKSELMGELESLEASFTLIDEKLENILEMYFDLDLIKLSASVNRQLLQESAALNHKSRSIMELTLNLIELRNEDYKIAKLYPQSALINILKDYIQKGEKIAFDIKFNFENFLQIQQDLLTGVSSQQIIHEKLNENINYSDKIIFEHELFLLNYTPCIEPDTNISISTPRVDNESHNETFNESSSETLNESIPVINNSINLSVSKQCPETLNLTLPTIFEANFNQIETSVPQVNISSKQLISIGPQCCINNNCSACAQKIESPILFIHGHAFNEENTPEFSMNSFAKIQSKLAQEGIINAGEINNVQVPKGIYGQHNVPVSFRSTYYYINVFGIGEFEVSTQKSERIENYAIRLAEIVNDVKQRTGSNTVTIVAHSMGGLVAREYVALFGEGSLNKLITINTPHQGITGKVESFCNVFGSHKECEDMSEGSIFLKRLNARSTPSNTFVIRSTGCKMGDEFGDGVVTQENGKLKDSTDFLFEGKCTDSLKTDLHGKLLDPDLHPEVYEKLVEILT